MERGGVKALIAILVILIIVAGAVLVYTITKDKENTQVIANEDQTKIANNEASDAQIGAFLIGITQKGVNKEEFYAFASSMRKFARRVITDEVVVDSCGTGADFSGTINVS